MNNIKNQKDTISHLWSLLPWGQFTYFMSFPSALMDRLAKWAIPVGIAFTGVSSSIYTGKTLE